MLGENVLKNNGKIKLMNQKGFAPILLLIGIVIVMAVVVGAYYFGKLPIKPTDNNLKACTQEAKICPDGSVVGRTGPNCEFSACTTITPTKTSNETTN